MTVLTCVSPIDGSVYAERPVMTLDEAGNAVAKAKAAQRDWAARPLAERIALVRAGVAKLGARYDVVVPELAHMMGRPIRYGGEFAVGIVPEGVFPVPPDGPANVSGLVDGGIIGEGDLDDADARVVEMVGEPVRGDEQTVGRVCGHSAILSRWRIVCRAAARTLSHIGFAYRFRTSKSHIEIEHRL